MQPSIGIFIIHRITNSGSGQHINFRNHYNHYCHSGTMVCATVGLGGRWCRAVASSRCTAQRWWQQGQNRPGNLYKNCRKKRCLVHFLMLMKGGKNCLSPFMFYNKLHYFLLLRNNATSNKIKIAAPTIQTHGWLNIPEASSGLVSMSTSIFFSSCENAGKEKRNAKTTLSILQ